MRKIALLFSVILMGSLTLSAQNQRVSGRVTGPDGGPVGGVTVIVSGTTVASITTNDGQYSLNAPANGTLEFSLLGMESQSVPVSGRSVINVQLQGDAQAIDDVIVVAYGLVTREAFTGSASVLGGEDIAKRQVSNVTKALSGAVAGVQAYSSNGQPGTAARIRIRGVGSINASAEPLIVLDGVPFGGDMSSINTADIESMTVMKDAAAAAIYGARGANGVILINTKRGTAREATISFDAKWGSSFRGVSQYDVMTDPGMFMETMYQAFYNSLDPSLSVASRNATANARIFSTGGTQVPIYTIPEGQQLIGTNGKLNPYATLGYSNGRNYFIPDDWYKESFQKGKFRQEYNFAVSGSGDKTNYYFSAGYLDDPGFIPNSGIERITTRLNADFRAREWLTFTTNISYTHSDSAYPRDQDGGSPTSNGSIFYVSNYIAPVYPVYVRDASGNIMVDVNGLTVYDYGDGKQTGIARPFASMANPIGQLQLDYRRYNMDILSGRWGVTADIIDGLRAQASIGVDLDNTDFTEQGNKYYGQWAESGGNVYRQRAREFQVNQQYLLTYTRRFGEHNMDILAGYENYIFESSYLDGRKDNIYNPKVYELDNAVNSPYTFSGRDSRALMSFFARGQYDYKNKYFASVSYRRDASSRFHPDHRWGNFGAVSGAWIISNEDFFSVAGIDFLKLKASWGSQGNDALLYPNGYANYYPYADQYALTESEGGFSTALSFKGNPDITWETSKTLNVGVEFELFNGRLGGSVEFFNKNTSDLLYDKPVSPSAGYSTIPTNIGNMRNRGVELDLHATILDLNNFRWDVNANGMYLQNKILSLIGEPIINGNNILIEGGSRYNMYLKEYAGVATENFSGKDNAGNDKSWAAGDALYWMSAKDANGNSLPQEMTGNWAAADQRDTGSLIPKFSGGFGTTLSFYGFDVSAQFAYQLGGKVYDDGYRMLMHSGMGTGGTNWHKDILAAWTPGNTNTDVPALNSIALYANSASTRFLISSDYLSINNITVGYTLPRKLVEKLDIGSVRIYFTGDNLAVFSKRKGLDPRQTLAGVTASYSYSAMRSFNGGITLSF